MKDNIDIFSCAYKKCTLPVTNKAYKILSVGKNTELYGNNIFRDDEGDNISDMNGFYSEITGYYWVWKNYELKDWIGFCHYRRFLGFMDNVPDMDEMDCDMILPTPLRFRKSIYQQYCKHHNYKDIDCLIHILHTKFNITMETLIDFFHHKNYLFSFNIFVMRKDLFNDYCQFLFSVLNEYCKENNILTMEDVYSQVENDGKNYYNNFYPENNVKYQSRIGGFLSERIFNLWIYLNNFNIKTCNIVITEEKYKNINKRQSDFCK